MSSSFVRKFLLSLALLAGLIFIITEPAISQEENAPVVVVEYADPLPAEFRLGRKISESSGIIFFDEGFWTFNDSGGKPELYKLRTTDGVLVKTVVLQGATNVDWEDITQDADFIYVGDFGNNRGGRRDLKIYKVRKKSVMVGQRDVTEPEVIEFSFGDQQSYSNPNRNHDYDCEAVIAFENSLILFTKNWANNNTRLYRLSKKPGKYTLNPIAEFEAGGLVTAADYNAAEKQLVLLGYSDWIPFVYLFKEFSGSDFEAAERYRINFPAMTGVQTEGICFAGTDKLVISSELTDVKRQAVYVINMSDLIPPPENSEEE